MAIRKQAEINNCINCGSLITDWEETEQTNNELIMTYVCACGCRAEQHFKLTYVGTEIIA